MTSSDPNDGRAASLTNSNLSECRFAQRISLCLSLSGLGGQSLEANEAEGQGGLYPGSRADRPTVEHVHLPARAARAEKSPAYSRGRHGASLDHACSALIRRSAAVRARRACASS